MKNITTDQYGNEVETTMTRSEVLSHHSEIVTNYQRGMALLDGIREELGLNSEGLKAAREEQKEQSERNVDEGLTSEINTSKTLVKLEDTIAGIITVLTKHPHGFRGDGTRHNNGSLKGTFKPFTPEEDADAESWAAGPKLGKEWAETGKLSTDCWNGE